MNRNIFNELKNCKRPTVLPIVFDDSMSYYELICKLVNKMNEIIDYINKNGENVK